MRRTMQTVRDKLKTRPLPKIPLPSHKFTRQLKFGSGDYCSIRSDRPNEAHKNYNLKALVTKQDSCQSVNSYMEPFSVSAMMDLDSKNSNGVTTDMYISPVATENIEPAYEQKTEEPNYENTHLDSTYVQNDPAKTGNTNIYQNGHIMKQTLSDIDTKIQSDSSKDFKQSGISKTPVIQMDSHGYVPMKRNLRKLILGNSVFKHKQTDKRHHRLTPDEQGTKHTIEHELTDDSQPYGELWHGSLDSKQTEKQNKEGVTEPTAGTITDKRVNGERVNNKKYVKTT